MPRLTGCGTSSPWRLPRCLPSRADADVRRHALEQDVLWPAFIREQISADSVETAGGVTSALLYNLRSSLCFHGSVNPNRSLRGSFKVSETAVLLSLPRGVVLPLLVRIACRGLSAL